MNVLVENDAREEAVFTPLAFDRLLRWLDDGAESHGERYLEMRRRLVAYFDRRHRTAADELADETLSRIGRTLERDGAIQTRPPARYCYVIARFVLLEDVRRARKETHLDEGRLADTPEPDEYVTIHEQRLDRLERSLEQLLPDQRELVVEYYRDAGRPGIEHRRRMAERLGITNNALGLRAFRIRERLMNSVAVCQDDVRR